MHLMTLYLRMKPVSTVQPAGVNLPHILVAYNARILIVVHRGGDRGWSCSHWWAGFLGWRTKRLKVGDNYAIATRYLHFLLNRMAVRTTFVVNRTAVRTTLALSRTTLVLDRTAFRTTLTANPFPLGWCTGVSSTCSFFLLSLYNALHLLGNGVQRQPGQSVLVLPTNLPKKSLEVLPATKNKTSSKTLSRATYD